MTVKVNSCASIIKLFSLSRLVVSHWHQNHGRRKGVPSVPHSSRPDHHSPQFPCIFLHSLNPSVWSWSEGHGWGWLPTSSSKLWKDIQQLINCLDKIQHTSNKWDIYSLLRRFSVNWMHLFISIFYLKLIYCNSFILYIEF